MVSRKPEYTDAREHSTIVYPLSFRRKTQTFKTQQLKLTIMAHRKHIIKKQGELVATTASEKEKPQKCLLAYQNRQALKKAIKTYENNITSVTIEDQVSDSSLRKLRELKGVRYYVTILEVRKEITPNEAAICLKGGIKVEIVEG